MAAVPQAPTSPPRRSEADGSAPEPEGAEPVAVPTVRAAIGSLAAAAHPRAAAAEAVHVGRDLVTILRGSEDFMPSPADKRFSDPAWRSNGGYRRTAQSYLALGASLNRLVDRYEAAGADWRSVERARFTVNALVSTLAPTNTLVGNPAALKRALDTGGRSLLRGVRHAMGDLLHNGGMPSQTDRSAFAVGRDLALAAGAVVHRDDVMELIQYTPTTDRVHRRPLVVIPPPIGRYYFLDLRPGRSFVEFAVAQGFQVFLVSWRNPTRAQAGWDLDMYADAVRRAVDVARDITGSPDVNTQGFCAGGIITATTLNHLAATGHTAVHSAGFAVTLLDFDTPAPIGAFSGRRTLGLARRNSRARGVISARQMGAAFTWMRPDDLVFNYLVNQWLMGEEPLPFDVLAWNADGTNMSAALHGQFLDIFEGNLLAQPGAMTVLGTPVDLGRITVPTFVTGALTDHLTPWEGCYRTTQLLGGPSTFVLSSSGHIQSLINPPGNPKASYWSGGTAWPHPETWRAEAERHSGSWWEPWARWMTEQSGEEIGSPGRPGNDLHPVLEPAPGSYVVDRVTSAR